MARVSYVDKEQADPEVQKLFENLESRGLRVLNLYRALAHSPATMLNFMRLGNSLLTKASLEPKLRELAILRVAQLTDSRYEWTQHLPIALEAGVRQDQVDSLVYWPRSTAFDGREQAAIAYTDEVTERVRVTGQTFDRLRKHFDDTAIVELTLTIAYWGMVARLLVALQVDPEEPAGSLRSITGR